VNEARVPWTDIPGLLHGFGRRGTEAELAVRVQEAGAALFTLRQVHGRDLVVPPWDEPPAADAAGTVQPGLVLAIQTADCLPVLIVDPRGRRVAAAHAGWRGTAAGILTHAIRWLQGRGSRAEDLRIALGPCIGPCCYEVGDELPSQFDAAAQAAFAPGPRGRLHFDLRGANERQALSSGVPAGHIAHVAECTRCHPELYYSYRRDGAGTGRMISYLGWTRD
jgi:YfiH family protein